MNVIFRTLLVLLGLTLAIQPVMAFDNDFEINNINLGKENFLDIKAYQYRKSLEYQWFESPSGWRSSLVSLTADLASVQTELKLQNELSDYVDIRFQVEQDVFYADKEFPLPLAEIVFYPWAGNLGFSVVGTPAHEKREADLGYAVSWGKDSWNYTRFEYLDVDQLYNNKNIADNTFYNKEPIKITLEGAYQFGGHYKMRYSISQDKPLELIDPDNSGNFKHKASDYFLLFDYQPIPDSVIGITINGFTLDKTSVKTGQNQQQETDYVSADIYLVRGLGKDYEFRVGAQYDYIRNDIRDFIFTSRDLDYFMKTSQVYTTVYHPFNEHMAWDLGLYVGQVEEQQNYPQNSARNTMVDSTEAKFRFGFEHLSSDGRSSFQLSFSLNLDDFIDDPGDGGAISFQSVF